jgi:hypothetical protein
MERTTAMVAAWVPIPGLAEMIMEYMVPPGPITRADAAEHGCYELVMGLASTNWNAEMFGACRGGHAAIVDHLIITSPTGVAGRSAAMYYACRTGDAAMVAFVGASDMRSLNEGLAGACYGGHMEMARLMIKRGANNADRGYTEAQHAGHDEIADYMVRRGATRRAPMTFVMVENGFYTLGRYVQMREAELPGSI